MDTRPIGPAPNPVELAIARFGIAVAEHTRSMIAYRAVPAAERHSAGVVMYEASEARHAAAGELRDAIRAAIAESEGR